MYRSILVVGVALVAMLTVAAAGATAGRDAALRGVDFIRTTQQADGGFGGFGPGQTFDAVYAIRAAGVDPRTVTTGGKSPVDFLRANLADVAASPSLAGKAALAALALGLNPRDVDGVDLVAAAQAGRDAGTGALGPNAFNHAIVLLGIVCTGNAVPAGAVDFIRASQLEDGGWGFGESSDPDSTAIVLQALLAAGVPSSDGAAAAAVAFLRASQGSDGGWGFDPNESNANSTAYVIQALIAAGEDLASVDYQVGGVGPLAFLLSLQQADGSFPGFDPAYATNQAVPALAGRTFCNAPQTPIQTVTPPATPTPSPSPAVTPVPQPSPSPTVIAPAPPATGSGTAGSDPSGIIAAGIIVLLAGAGLCAATLFAR